MTIRASFLPLAAAAAALALGGCTDLKRAVGLEKVVPDEFAVVSSAPLAIPPDYSLRPPRPGASPSQEVSPTDQAKQSIFRAGDQQAALPAGADQRSAGENELLRQAGASNAQSDIRQTITKEVRAGSPVDSSFVDMLLFWRGPDTPATPPDSVIDPLQEAQKMRGTQTAGLPGSTPSGMTAMPTIERRGQPRLVNRFGS
ncbi:MAG TPA: DUF3035 domain-containing protein [Stellaceae bacterium]|nr:DUF3035 domain-containing protein [Stellaceae bacterium]